MITARYPFQYQDTLLPVILAVVRFVFACSILFMKTRTKTTDEKPLMETCLNRFLFHYILVLPVPMRDAHYLVRLKWSELEYLMSKLHGNN